MTFFLLLNALTFCYSLNHTLLFCFVRIAFIDVVLQFGYDIIFIMYTDNFNFRYS